MVLDGLPGLYGLKYDSATACGLPMYLCSYKLDGSIIEVDLVWEQGSHLLTIQFLCSLKEVDNGITFRLFEEEHFCT